MQPNEATDKPKTGAISVPERLLGRVLRPFAKIEPGEAVVAVVLTFTVFLLLTAYYFLKTAREPLILLQGGAEVKSYAAAGQSVLLIVVVRAYSALARRVGRMRLVAAVYLFFAMNLGVFAVLAGAGARIGVVFYLWVGIFNVTAIAQFWSFAADIYAAEQGKRIFAIIGVGSSAGAVAGARIARSLVDLGPAGLMTGALIVLCACVALLYWVDRRSGSPGKKPGDPSHEQPLVDARTFQLLTHDRYLLLVAALTFILNWVNTTGEYVLDRTLLVAASDAVAHGADANQFIGHFKAEYFEWVNILGMALQLFAVSRILDKLGVRNALFFLPAVALASYTTMIFVPLLSLIRVGKVLENGIDYSIQNTSRQALFLVTSRVEKFVGKTVVDTLVVRVGDVFSAIMVYVGTLLALPTKAFAILNVVLIGVWILVIVFIGREHARRSAEGQALVDQEPLAS